MSIELQNKLNKRDASEFLRWQQRERLNDELKAAVHIAERKAGAKCARCFQKFAFTLTYQIWIVHAWLF